MEMIDKIRILTDAAKYDASCSSSGSSRKNNGGLGAGAKEGICHSWSDDGRCISLLKILLTNHCIYDCEYCVNRRSNTVERTMFSIDEVVDLTINFYKRNYIEGLFLSSGIFKSCDYTMELFIEIAKRLREEEKFNGYIHMKAIPGSSKELIRRLGEFVDRLSVNIELPSENSLKILAPDKNKKAILEPMKDIKEEILQSTEDKKIYKKAPLFAPAGQTTQMIIGASGENDLDIIRLSQSLYSKVNLKRVYYSAYIPVNKTDLIPYNKLPPLSREHRIYQADWLIRYYKFNADEILSDSHPFFDLELDPKANWAINNIHLFPMEINKASYEELLRIPGIGPTSAHKIIRARRQSALTHENLKSMRISLKRAKYFITCKGVFKGADLDNISNIRKNLSLKDMSNFQQLSFLE